MTSPTTPEQLAACPFCGDPGSLITHHEQGTVLHPWYRIECDNCGAKGPGTDQGNHADLWTRRTLSTQHAAAVEIAAQYAAERDSLRAELAKLQARERACDTMQQAEAIALVRMGQELAEAVGLDPLTASPAEIVAAVAQARAELEGLKAMQQVGEAVKMSGAAAFTTCCFDARVVPPGAALFAAPPTGEG